MLVPLNYRLATDDFRYLIQHSGASVVCVSADYQATIDAIREDLPGVAHFVALDTAAD